MMSMDVMVRVMVTTRLRMTVGLRATTRTAVDDGGDRVYVI